MYMSCFTRVTHLCMRHVGIRGLFHTRRHLLAYTNAKFNAGIVVMDFGTSCAKKRIPNHVFHGKVNLMCTRLRHSRCVRLPHCFGLLFLLLLLSGKRVAL